MFDENREAVQVYQQIGAQYIYGPNGPVDIDLRAVETAMGRMRIDDDGVFWQVVALGRDAIKAMENSYMSRTTHPRSKRRR